VAYDSVASAIAPYDNAAASEVAGRLDTEVLGLLREATGVQAPAAPANTAVSVAAEKWNRIWYTRDNGDAADDAKNKIRNSPARIQNATALGSILRLDRSPVPGPGRTLCAASLGGFACSFKTNPSSGGH
jgi:hypothetical protein